MSQIAIASGNKPNFFVFYYQSSIYYYSFFSVFAKQVIDLYQSIYLSVVVYLLKVQLVEEMLNLAKRCRKTHKNCFFRA